VISGLRVPSSNSIGPVEQYFSYAEFKNARGLSKTTGDITSWNSPKLHTNALWTLPTITSKSYSIQASVGHL
jgi:hypothetical protein